MPHRLRHSACPPPRPRCRLQNARARREGRLAPTSKRELADFKREEHHEAWDIVAVGPPQAGDRPAGLRGMHAVDAAQALQHGLDGMPHAAGGCH